MKYRVGKDSIPMSKGGLPGAGGIASIAVATLTVLGLAACTPGESKDSNSSSAPSSSSAQASQGLISPQLPEIPALDGAKGIRANTTLAQCSTKPGAVSASGKVKNSTAETADLVVTVDWVTASSDVMARGVVVLKGVPAGESKDWKVNAQLSYQQPVNCILTAQAGTLK
ncbi:hypothetical protein [Psychromicrobium lacuslunae]|uniref:Uncharacterized protein n=1 Tax=Psychromicrobium lacuslunae TaxID=1618207 RepID=A0A0D4C050_9MICC|nr:hypothetical protein [Psychromicrobium lacuslunae]AJT42032.1 hypothetical protein UM93_11855 [Psychromicrobium lacuslunae]